MSQYSNNITAVAAASKTEVTKEWAVQGLGAAHEVLLPRSLRTLAGSQMERGCRQGCDRDVMSPDCIR